MDSARREESKEKKMPRGTRWAILKSDQTLTDKQQAVPEELSACGFYTATALRVEDLLGGTQSRH